MQSENINELAGALSKAQGEFPPIKKTKKATIPTKAGGSYSYDYADLGDIREAVTPILAKNGLAVTQAPTVYGDQPALTTTLMHSSGQWIESEMLLHIEKTDAQGQGSAITYGRRYAISAILGIVTESDDDGAVATQNYQQRQPSTAVYKEPTEADSEDIKVILKAASQTDDPFLNDLAAKYKQYGKLSEKQIGAGVRSAMKVLNQPKPPFDPEFADGSERF